MRKGIVTGLLGIGLLALTGFCLWTVAEPRETRPSMVELWVPPPEAAPPAPPPQPSSPPAGAPETPAGTGASSEPPPRVEKPAQAVTPPAPEEQPLSEKPKQQAAAPPAPAGAPAKPKQEATGLPAPPGPPALSPAELAAARRNVDALARKLAAPAKPADGGFDAVLRDLRTLKRQQLASAGEVEPAAPEPSVPPIELVRRQLLPCWERRDGPRGPSAPSVQIRLQLDPAGRVVRTETVDRSRLEDPLYRAIATSAVRAILQCQPVTPPPGPPASWAVLTMTFVP